MVYPRRHVMRAFSVRGRKGSGSHVWIATMLLVINTNETISFTSHIAMQLPAVDSCFDCSSETITFELSVSVDCIAMFLLWRHGAQKNIFFQSDESLCVFFFLSFLDQLLSSSSVVWYASRQPACTGSTHMSLPSLPLCWQRSTPWRCRRLLRLL